MYQLHDQEYCLHVVGAIWWHVLLWKALEQSCSRLYSDICLIVVDAAPQDAYLPQRLVDKLMYMYNYIEMARVTGVPMSFLLTRGQSIKVFSQILRKARQRNLLVPFIKVALPFFCKSNLGCQDRKAEMHHVTSFQRQNSCNTADGEVQCGVVHCPAAVCPASSAAARNPLSAPRVACPQV